MSNGSRHTPFPTIESDDQNSGKPQWFTKTAEAPPSAAPSWSQTAAPDPDPSPADTELTPADSTSHISQQQEQQHAHAIEHEPAQSEAQPEAQQAEPHKLQQELEQEPQQAQLEQLRAQVHEEIYQQSHEQGYQEGLQAGEKAGFDEGMNRATQAVAEQTTLLETIITATKVWQAAEEQQQLKELSELICVLTEQVVLTELKLNPELVTKAISAAFQSLPRGMGDASAEVAPMITINPADLERVTGLQEREKKHWQIVTDDTVEQGGCLVKTAQSDVDASVEHRLQQAKAAIRMVFDDAPHP